MPWPIWLKPALTVLSLLIWLLSLVMSPFGGEEIPGILLLVAVCTVGLVYPTVAPFGLLNYAFVYLVCYNLAGRGSRRIGVGFLIFFAASVLHLLFRQYVLLESYNTGELRSGALLWMLSLALAGTATILRGNACDAGRSSFTESRARG